MQTGTGEVKGFEEKLESHFPDEFDNQSGVRELFMEPLGVDKRVLALVCV